MVSGVDEKGSAEVSEHHSNGRNYDSVATLNSKLSSISAPQLLITALKCPRGRRGGG